MFRFWKSGKKDGEAAVETVRQARSLLRHRSVSAGLHWEEFERNESSDAEGGKTAWTKERAGGTFFDYRDRRLRVAAVRSKKNGRIQRTWFEVRLLGDGRLPLGLKVDDKRRKLFTRYLSGERVHKHFNVTGLDLESAIVLFDDAAVVDGFLRSLPEGAWPRNGILRRFKGDKDIGFELVASDDHRFELTRTRLVGGGTDAANLVTEVKKLEQLADALSGSRWFDRADTRIRHSAAEEQERRRGLLGKVAPLIGHGLLTCAFAALGVAAATADLPPDSSRSAGVASSILFGLVFLYLTVEAFRNLVAAVANRGIQAELARSAQPARLPQQREAPSEESYAPSQSRRSGALKVTVTSGRDLPLENEAYQQRVAALKSYLEDRAGRLSWLRRSMWIPVLGALLVLYRVLPDGYRNPSLIGLAVACLVATAQKYPEGLPDSPAKGRGRLGPLAKLQLRAGANARIARRTALPLIAASVAMTIYGIRERDVGRAPLLIAGGFALMAVALWCFHRVVLRRLRARPAHEPFESVPDLMVLWVFGVDRRAKLFHDWLGGQWQYLGTRRMLRGPGLGHRFDFAELARGYDALVIDNEGELDAAVRGWDKQRDASGRFPLNILQCADSTWKDALQRLLKDAEIVFMDLAGFDPTAQGCTFELYTVMECVPIERFVAIIDRTTDVPFLQSVLRRAWIERSAGSVNRQANAVLELLEINGSIEGVHQIAESEPDTDPKALMSLLCERALRS